jgi:hypothetical protein
MTIKRNPATGKIIAKRFTLEQIMQASDDQCGFCLACGAEADGVEPDARKYACEACGNKLVYGAEEIAMMGLVK